MKNTFVQTMKTRELPTYLGCIFPSFWACSSYALVHFNSLDRIDGQTVFVLFFIFLKISQLYVFTNALGNIRRTGNTDIEISLLPASILFNYLFLFLFIY